MKLRNYITGKRLAKEQKAQGYLKYNLMFLNKEIIDELSQLYGEGKMKTHQELINLYKNKTDASTSHAEVFIDFLIETGIIEVKKEESLEQKLRSVGYSMSILLYDLDKIGLKIVEK